METARPGEQQYANTGNLQSRIDLNARFSTSRYPYPRWIFDQFIQKENCRLLELGCGTGLLWRMNGERIPASWRIVLSDLSPAMVTQARKSIKGHEDQFDALILDAEDIGLSERSFDAALASHMLYHLAHLKKALGEIVRVLKPDGVFYVTTAGKANLSELRDLLHAFKGQNPEICVGDAIDGFSLENGEAQLCPFFSSVELRMYRNSLEITDADAIVEYFLSLGDMKKGERLLLDNEIGDFRSFVQKKMDLAGKIHVSKDTGMFVCRI